MSDRFNKFLYDEKSCLWRHALICFVICLIAFVLTWFFKIISVQKFLKFVNSDIVNLSATIAGFEFAGVSIFISLEEIGRAHV